MSRKLAAIMSANASDYGRLMSDDEAATVKTLITYRKLIFDIIGQYQGRVVDYPGNNILAEFSSTINSTEAAVSIKKTIEAHNNDLPVKRRMEYSIGINIGDIIVMGNRIYGESVNIVARLQQITLPGEIYLSRCAYDQVEGKMPFQFEYLGKRTVKNIRKPLHVYKVLSEPEEVENVWVKKPGFQYNGIRPELNNYTEVFRFLYNLTMELKKKFCRNPIQRGAYIST